MSTTHRIVDDKEMAIMRIILQTSKRAWGSYNDAKQTSELHYDYKMLHADISKTLMIDVSTVHKRITIRLLAYRPTQARFFSAWRTIERTGFG